MIVLPTLGRPYNLCRFIGAYLATRATLPVLVVLTGDDANKYHNITLPAGFSHTLAPEGTKLGPLLNMVFEQYPNEPYYGFMADDIIPSTPGWDTQLRDACMSNKIAWGDDGIQGANLPTHAFIGGDLLRSLGWWVAPGIQHWFMDNAWKDIADALGIGDYLSDVSTTHYHFINGRAPQDETYRNQPSHEADAATYQKFKQDELPKIIERINGISTVGAGFV